MMPSHEVVKHPDSSAISTTRPSSSGITFAYPGLVSAGKASPIWYSENGQSFTIARISQPTTGSGNTDVEIYHVGVGGSSSSLLYTITLPNGSWTTTTAVSISLAAGEGIYLNTGTTVNANNLSVQLS